MNYTGIYLNQPSKYGKRKILMSKQKCKLRIQFLLGEKLNQENWKDLATLSVIKCFRQVNPSRKFLSFETYPNRRLKDIYFKHIKKVIPSSGMFFLIPKRSMQS